MTQIAISDDVATSLASAATARGCTQDELASVLIAEGLRREELLELSVEQEGRLLESVEQAKRGELIDGDVVMARFDAALQQTAALPATQMSREEVATLLQRRTEQSKSSDAITSEEVDVWFSDLFKELEAR